MSNQGHGPETGRLIQNYYEITKGRVLIAFQNHLHFFLDYSRYKCPIVAFGKVSSISFFRE